MVDRDQLLARLDDRLERVGEARDDDDLQRRLAVVGAKAGRRVGDVGRGRQRARRASRAAAGASSAARTPRSATTSRSPITMSALARDDRLDELRDVLAAVLVVGVGVDDHVGAELQRGVHAGLERAREALVVGQAHDVVDAAGAGDARPCRRSSRRRSPATRSRRIPAAARGRSASVAGSCSASSLQGIWMISFIVCGAGRAFRPRRCRKLAAQYPREARSRQAPPPAVDLWGLPRSMALASATGNALPARLARRGCAPMPAATWAKRRLRGDAAHGALGRLPGCIPTYPIYDTEYYLLWGREILHGQLPSFTVYDAPTEHPLGSRVRHGPRDLRQRGAAARGALRDRLVPAARVAASTG